MKELESRQVSPKAALKEKRIITEAQFASLLQDISKIANNNEVKILQLKPFRQSLPANQDAKVKALGSFTPFLISLDLSSGYHNLGKFINGLENLESFVKVQEIKIEPFEDTYLNQKVNLVFVTYVKK
jgi:Tfp pilus assembly protein PilO